MLTVWLGTMVVGSFLSQLNQWIDDPGSAVDLLGTAVPKVPLPASQPGACKPCLHHSLAAVSYLAPGCRGGRIFSSPSQVARLIWCSRCC